MKALVATYQTQGTRKNDFFWTKAGELVTFGFECDGETIDGGCGCKRSMVGTLSHKATTTFSVVDFGRMTEREYRREINKAYKEMGFEKAPKGTIENLLEIAGQHTHGTVLERRGNKFNVRYVGQG
jgi:hypothetical protein